MRKTSQRRILGRYTIKAGPGRPKSRCIAADLCDPFAYFILTKIIYHTRRLHPSSCFCSEWSCYWFLLGMLELLQPSKQPHLLEVSFKSEIKTALESAALGVKFALSTGDETKLSSRFVTILVPVTS